MRNHSGVGAAFCSETICPGGHIVIATENDCARLTAGVGQVKAAPLSSHAVRIVATKSKTLVYCGILAGSMYSAMPVVGNALT